MKTFVHLLVLLAGISVYMHAAALKGTWLHNGIDGSISLEFLSDSELIYDGERMPYMIVGNRIRVPDDYTGYTDYPYRLQKGKLSITFPDGSTVVFKPVRKTVPSHSAKNGGSQTTLLQGMLCTYSSSYNGGYSHSDRVYFDGAGHFSTSAETYSAGDSGTYANHQDNNGGGSYSVTGNSITITYPGGTVYRGKVIERAGNGRITGINVNGNIFSSRLCD